ncbi:MAG: long-chain fatty acid--CoA ligase [Firmicutes bacterium]|nr:long-chain fatty acid--CoA ligase [Bacillota bacterium]
MKKIQELKPIFPSVFHKDFRALLDYTAQTYEKDDAFIVKHRLPKQEPTYEHITYGDFRCQVNHLGTAFFNRGFLGKRIAILGKNRYEWMLTYFTTLCGIGICVPLDKGLPYDEVESSLIRSYADVLVFDPAHLLTVEELKKSGKTQVTDFICMDELEGYSSLPELLTEGKALWDGGERSYESLPIDPEAVSIILFTSGTTSMAKAVQLSQQNITSNVYSMLKVEDVRHGDINMAFLPYHHTFGSTGQIVMLAAGTTTTYCDGLKYLQKNIVEYKVSVFVCVPLLIESIYKRIWATVKKQGLEGKVNLGLKLSKILGKIGIDVRRKLFKEILDQLGGNLRLVISGASAIDPLAMEGFNAFGIDTVQGYGMTEASPVLASENCQTRRTGSIGKAMPGVELAIDEPNPEGIGELIARGPNVMLGYYENNEETAKVLKDGWLHTGDLAYVDEDGFIFICGRKKNVIVLKNGKNVYPEELELLISNLPYVEENMVFGQPRHKDGDLKDLALCAKIVYKPDYMKETYGTDNPSQIEAIIKKDIDAINDNLPTYKQMLRIIVTDEPMIKTTTGKVKRFEEEKRL